MVKVYILRHHLMTQDVLIAFLEFALPPPSSVSGLNLIISLLLFENA